MSGCKIQKTPCKQTHTHARTHISATQPGCSSLQHRVAASINRQCSSHTTGSGFACHPVSCVASLPVWGWWGGHDLILLEHYKLKVRIGHLSTATISGNAAVTTYCANKMQYSFFHFFLFFNLFFPCYISLSKFLQVGVKTSLHTRTDVHKQTLPLTPEDEGFGSGLRTQAVVPN